MSHLSEQQEFERLYAERCRVEAALRKYGILPRDAGMSMSPPYVADLAWTSGDGQRFEIKLTRVPSAPAAPVVPDIPYGFPEVPATIPEKDWPPQALDRMSAHCPGQVWPCLHEMPGAPPEAEAGYLAVVGAGPVRGHPRAACGCSCPAAMGPVCNGECHG